MKQEENLTPRKFEELSETEKALRSLIYAAEHRHETNSEYPSPSTFGDDYLSVKLNDAKSAAVKAGIPLA
jgi:hypothetical protein